MNCNKEEPNPKSYPSPPHFFTRQATWQNPCFEMGIFSALRSRGSSVSSKKSANSDPSIQRSFTSSSVNSMDSTSSAKPLVKDQAQPYAFEDRAQRDMIATVMMSEWVTLRYHEKLATESATAAIRRRFRDAVNFGETLRGVPSILCLVCRI